VTHTTPKRSALIVAAPVLAVAGVAAAANPAVADSTLCRQVQAEYSAAGRVARSGGYATLRKKLRLERSRLERGNCSGLGLFRKRSQDCPAIMGRVRRLESQLQNAAGQRTAARRRDTLRSVLVRNGCSVPGSGGSSAASNRLYRTLCVRTCDGYYFPVGNSASRSRAKIDQAVCQKMYGGAEAKLFVQRRSRPVGDATSPADGSKYGDLAEAFAYRKRFDPACYTELHAGLATYMAGAETRQSGERAGDAATPIPLPLGRPRNMASDPETLANRAGHFTVAPVGPAGEPGGRVAMRRFGTDYNVVVHAIPNLKKFPGPNYEFDLITSAAAEERDPTSVQ
jgi:Protein of unknown function (DUF2865)